MWMVLLPRVPLEDEVCMETKALAKQVTESGNRSVVFLAAGHVCLFRKGGMENFFRGPEARALSYERVL